MSFASILGKYAGILAAESVWALENGAKLSVAYLVTTNGIAISELSIKKISQFAIKHSINSNDPESVTNNLFNCLEYID